MVPIHQKVKVMRNNITHLQGDLFLDYIDSNNWVALSSYYCATKTCQRGFSAQLQGHCRLSSHSAIPLVRANSQKTLSFFSRATCVRRVVVGRDGRLQACPALNFWTSRSRKSGGGMRQLSPASKQSAHWRQKV